MSLYEQALEEWKERDPHLLDLDGFQRFLENKRIIANHKEDKFHQRISYCTTKLRELIIEEILTREFGDITLKPINDWQDFYEMAKRYMQVYNGLGDWLPFDGFGLDKIKKHLGISLNLRSSYDAWRSLIKHPEWFADWDVACGAKGFTGSGYSLRLWFAVCVELGLRDRALEILNNLPEELRHPAGVPDYIQKYIEEKTWKKTYNCQNCARETCEGCVPYIPSLRLEEKLEEV